MPRLPFPPTTWPVLGLSLLLTVACLSGIGYINRLQAELGDSLRTDAARLQAAQQAQIHLREYRVHTVLLAAGPSDTRRRQVDEDRRLLLTSLEDLDQLAVGEDDRADLAELRAGWQRYEAGLAQDLHQQTEFPSVNALAAWADNHRVGSLLVPCGRLVERSQARMSEANATSAEQTRWAGRTLLVVGLVGPLAGLVGGYTTARSLSRRVARLSVRLQAAQSHLDQEVGAVTLERPDSLADLDQQLGVVVDRVGAVCRRLQEQERELLRAEQLAAVGNLAAGVAHEVRNPLTGIKMMVEAALRPASPSPLTDTDLGLIRDEITRLERTVQGLLDYAKPAPPVRRSHDLRPTITRAVEIVAAQAERADVAVETQLPTEPVVVLHDPDQFLSLLTNLLLNAFDATPPGGRVTVAARREDRADAVVAVSDTGRGIPPEMADKLFMPFSTGKPSGTGLGLVVARRIAVEHGGTLTATNRAEGGACFTVTIPAAEDADAEVAGR